MFCFIKFKANEQVWLLELRLVHLYHIMLILSLPVWDAGLRRIHPDQCEHSDG